MREAEVLKGRELGKIGETAQQYCLNILKSKNVSREEAKKKRGNMKIQGTEGRRFGPPPPPPSLLQSIIPIDLDCVQRDSQVNCTFIGQHA